MTMEKIYTFTAILLGIALTITFTQPAWRGEEMLKDFKSNCDKRGGVLLEDERTFGTNYQCVSRLDK